MMMEYALKHLDGPVCIRYPKDEALDYPEYRAQDYPVEPGEAVQVCEGSDLVIVSTGTLLKEAIDVKNILINKNLKTGIFNLRFAKPISYNTISRLSCGPAPVIILEEGILNGGISEELAILISRENPLKKVFPITLPEEYPPVGSREELLDSVCLTTGQIVNKINSMFAKI
jgi:1-deoxy-D-xylulose-5-phosphate synthase